MGNCCNACCGQQRTIKRKKSIKKDDRRDQISEIERAFQDLEKIKQSGESKNWKNLGDRKNIASIKKEKAPSFEQYKQKKVPSSNILLENTDAQNQHIQDLKIRHSDEPEQYFQKQQLVNTAQELQSELVTLTSMYENSLTILFELQNWKRQEYPVEKLTRNCLKRYQLAEKMIMNSLEQLREQTPYGKAASSAFLSRARAMQEESEKYIHSDQVKTIISKFNEAVEKGENIWKNKRVIDRKEVKSPEEATVNYLISLLNKGLIEGDKKQEELKETGEVKMRTVQELHDRAVKKVEKELKTYRSGGKTEGEKFKENFDREVKKQNQEVSWR